MKRTTDATVLFLRCCWGFPMPFVTKDLCLERRMLLKEECPIWEKQIKYV